MTQSEEVEKELKDNDGHFSDEELIEISRLTTLRIYQYREEGKSDYSKDSEMLFKIDAKTDLMRERIPSDKDQLIATLRQQKEDILGELKWFFDRYPCPSGESPTFPNVHPDIAEKLRKEYEKQME